MASRLVFWSPVLVVIQRAGAAHHHRDALRRSGLHERTHALLERADGAGHGVEVGLLVARARDEVLVLLRADRGRGLEVLLRGRAVLLVLDELLVQLALLGLLRLERGLELGDLLPRVL